MAHLSRRIRQKRRIQSLIDGPPGFAPIIAAKRTSGRNRHIHTPFLLRIEKDRVQTHSTCSWLPMGPRAVTAQPGKLLPALASVRCAKDRRVLHPRVNRIWVRKRRLKMPDPFEFPRMRRAVIPLVCTRLALIDESVINGLPGLASIIRALNLLTKPSTRLRSIEAVGISRRSFEMIDLPAAKVRALHVPALALSIGFQQKRTFTRTHKDSYFAHRPTLCQHVKNSFGFRGWIDIERDKESLRLLISLRRRIRTHQYLVTQIQPGMHDLAPPGGRDIVHHRGIGIGDHGLYFCTQILFVKSKGLFALAFKKDICMDLHGLLLWQIEIIGSNEVGSLLPAPPSRVLIANHPFILRH